MSEILTGIAVLAARAREARDAADLIRQQRDSAIVEAIDRDGLSCAAVAKAADISRARVTVILGNATFSDHA